MAEALGSHLALIRGDGEREPVARSLAAIKADPELADDLEGATVRMVAPMINVEHVDSSAVSDFAYDEESRELYIRYRGGAAYTYHGVPPADYVEMRSAESIGKFVNQAIKPNYQVTKGAPI